MIHTGKMRGQYKIIRRFYSRDFQNTPWLQDLRTTLQDLENRVAVQ